MHVSVWVCVWENLNLPHYQQILVRVRLELHHLCNEEWFAKKIASTDLHTVGVVYNPYIALHPHCLIERKDKFSIISNGNVIVNGAHSS